MNTHRFAAAVFASCLLGLPVLAQTADGMAEHQKFIAYGDCIRRQAVRLSPSGAEPGQIVESAILACIEFSQIYRGALEGRYKAQHGELNDDDRLAVADTLKFAESFAGKIAMLDVLETRSHLPLSYPPFIKPAKASPKTP
jgi:hypothetical protein